jgi:hypothetical protein
MDEPAQQVVEASPPTSAGFFSSDKVMTLGVGPKIDPNGLRGYPIDMRVKAVAPEWPGDRSPGFLDYWVPIIQYGLGCHERWLDGDGDRWLDAALTTGRYLLAHQEQDGSWINRVPFPHTFMMPDRWRCAMAQGEAASLLMRLHAHAADDRFAEAARTALRPLWRTAENDGVGAAIDGGWWPEEYPTSPPSYVLNGAIFAWWGVRDVAVGLDDGDAGQLFQDGVDTLVANLPRFDLGWWTIYCLYPFPIPNIASSFYQSLHASQLDAMNMLAPRPELAETGQRWRAYLDSAVARRRALAQKVLFRAVVPRNRLLAYRLPWARRARTAS